MNHLKRTCYFVALLGLLACETASTGEVQPALTQEELMNPESCKECHTAHYEQWSASMHAYAANDPVFLAMNRRGQEATGGALGAFCVNCHAPMAVQTGAITDYANIESLPQELKGVTCYFCHNAAEVGAEHNNGNLILANDDIMRGPITNPTEPSTHKVAYSRSHDGATADSALMCGTCHDIVTPMGLHLEQTYLEYTQSVFAVEGGLGFDTCQGCHMPKAKGGKRPIASGTGRPGELVSARDFHPHLWPAVDVALTDNWPHDEALRSAVGVCELPGAMSASVSIERDPGPLGTITVVMEADPGHHFPSGATQDRRLWVELIAYDENMTELYRLGEIGPQQVEETREGEHPCMRREWMWDAAGEETHNFWDATTKTGKLMPFAPAAGAVLRHTDDCNFRPPIAQATVAPAFVDVIMRMRPMGIDVLQDLVSTGHLAPDVPARMPTFTVIHKRAKYNPETRSYGVFPGNIDPTLGDCDTFECLLDPQSPACLSAGMN